jgi:hypothetical protein
MQGLIRSLRLFSRVPSDPLAMSKLSIDQINTIVRPCGLAPKKAQGDPWPFRNYSEQTQEGKVP